MKWKKVLFIECNPEESYGAPQGNLIEDSYGSPHSEPIHKGWHSLELSVEYHACRDVDHRKELGFENDLNEVWKVLTVANFKDSYGAPQGNLIHEDSYGPPHAEPILKGSPILRLSLHHIIRKFVEKSIKYLNWYPKAMTCT